MASLDTVSCQDVKSQSLNTTSGNTPGNRTLEETKLTQRSAQPCSQKRKKKEKEKHHTPKHHNWQGKDPANFALQTTAHQNPSSFPKPWLQPHDNDVTEKMHHWAWQLTVTIYILSNILTHNL